MFTFENCYCVPFLYVYIISIQLSCNPFVGISRFFIPCILLTKWKLVDFLKHAWFFSLFVGSTRLFCFTIFLFSMHFLSLDLVHSFGLVIVLAHFPFIVLVAFVRVKYRKVNVIVMGDEIWIRNLKKEDKR